MRAGVGAVGPSVAGCQQGSGLSRVSGLSSGGGGIVKGRVGADVRRM